MMIIRLANLSFLILLVYFISGCAGPLELMRPVSEELAVSAPDEDRSLVVFLRPSNKGFASQPSIYFIKDNVPEFIGFIAGNKKVAFETEPGKYLFMVTSQNTDFLSAEILANKTYYIRIQPVSEIWDTYYYLRPIRFNHLESDEFNKWLSSCEWVERTPTSAAWFNQNKHTVSAKYEKHYPEWQAYDKSKHLTLLPGDGI